MLAASTSTGGSRPVPVEVSTDPFRPPFPHLLADPDAPGHNPCAKVGVGHNPRATVSTMSKTGYARVSTDDQDEAAQTDALRTAGCDVLYVDHASGKDMDRPQWKACVRSLGAGDTLVVTRIDRMGRSLVDLVGTLDALGDRGIEFRSLTEGIDTTTPGGRMVFQVCGAFAEYERALIRSRTREGMAAARARGAKIGRPAALTVEQAATARRLHAGG